VKKGTREPLSPFALDFRFENQVVYNDYKGIIAYPSGVIDFIDQNSDTLRRYEPDEYDLVDVEE
jgi:hypothetical protein